MLHISQIAGLQSAQAIVLMLHECPLLTLISFQTCMTYFLLWNTEQGYCKNFLSLCLLTLYGICGWTEARKSSQVTYVTMVPRMGNETLRPLGVATGNALSVTRVWRYICKNTTCWPATAHDVTSGVPQYKCRRENTSSASSSEACVRSMAQSLGDAVSRSPFGEPWLHT